MTDPVDPSPDPYAPPASSTTAERAPLNRRRVWRAVMIWFGFVAIGGVANLAMKAGSNPETAIPESWLAITAMVVGLVSSFGFLSFHVVLIVWLMTGYFRKP